MIKGWCVMENLNKKTDLEILKAIADDVVDILYSERIDMMESIAKAFDIEINGGHNSCGYSEWEDKYLPDGRYFKICQSLKEAVNQAGQ